jgi:pyruvate,orthophosphate dikinase
MPVTAVDSLLVSYVYAFDHKHRRPPMEYKDLLGGKGANLAEMTSVLKLPVPPGFTISTDACRAYMHGGWPDGLDEEIATQVFKLEKTMGRKLGDPFDPLLVSVRSGAKFSMPGMMDTVLNLGLNDESVKGLANVTGDERFAYDSYRRFIQMYSRGPDWITTCSRTRSTNRQKDHSASRPTPSCPPTTGSCVQATYKAVVKKASWAGPSRRSRRSSSGAPSSAVFASWNERPRQVLSPVREHQPRARHRGQRPDHGVRQPRREQRHRRGLHPQRLHRREQAPTATS